MKKIGRKDVGLKMSEELRWPDPRQPGFYGPDLPHYALQERLRQELTRYGLFDSGIMRAKNLEALLRHIYNNRDATYGCKDLTIELLQASLDEAKQEIEDLKAKLARPDEKSHHKQELFWEPQ